MNEAFRLVGQPRFGGILIVADHASNRVPEDIDLGIDPALLDNHIAVDLGVAGVAEHMAGHAGIAAFLGNVSRLVCDFNRQEDHHGLIPHASDGHAIPGNHGDVRQSRIDRFFHPYHNELSVILDRFPQTLILSLHSFTPMLASRPDEERPWDCGVLYNTNEKASRLAIALLGEEGLEVGDQQPYSGKLLNATMDRHAEAEGRPYFGLEIRQDRIATPAQQAEWAKRLVRICNRVALEAGE
jgi:predicted N-formylglutamate amidohydrolase